MYTCVHACVYPYVAKGSGDPCLGSGPVWALSCLGDLGEVTNFLGISPPPPPPPSPTPARLLILLQIRAMRWSSFTLSA